MPPSREQDINLLLSGIERVGQGSGGERWRRSRFLFYYLETARETDPSHVAFLLFSFSLSLSLFLLPRIRIVLFRVNRRRRRRNFDTLKSYFFSFLFFFFRECSECVRFLCYPFRRRRVETIKFLRVRSVFHSGERVDFIIFLEVKWILKRKMRSVYVSEMYKLSEYRFILDFTIKKCYSLSLLPGCYLSSPPLLPSFPLLRLSAVFRVNAMKIYRYETYIFYGELF